MKKQKEDVFEQYIRRKVEPIFNKVLQEGQPNPRRGRTSKIIRLIQPHNFRRYFAIFKDQKPYYNPTPISYGTKNHNSEHHFEDFYGCRIIVRKKLVEVINLWHQKQWRQLEADNIGQVNARIKEIEEEMEDQTVNAIKKFQQIHGGKIDFTPIKKREAEWGIHGDDYIDKIPRQLIIQDTTFKKVYDEKLEFLGEEPVRNYISNRAVEQIAPDIAANINIINSKFDAFAENVMKPVEELALNMKTHVGIMKEIKTGINQFNKTVKKLDSRMSQTNLKRWV